MATDSPMSNFNRKNPYVIQVKQQYENLMRSYELVSKSIIIYGGLCGLIFIVTLILSVWTNHLFFIITDIFFLAVSVILTHKYIKGTIKDDINSDIDHMVTLESNDILNISIEYVQGLLYKIHNCIGKVAAYIIWYKIYCIITTLLMLTICFYMIF